MRIFTKMRKLLMSQKDLILKVEKIENKLEGQNYEIKVLFDYLKKLMQEKDKRFHQTSRKRIGFSKDNNK